MRLGEIKQKLDKVLNENRHIKIDSESIFNGQAFSVTNYNYLVEILEITSEFSWSGIDKQEIEDQLLNKYPPLSTNVLPVEKFNILNSFIQKINEKIQIFYSVLEYIVPIQDEKVINIKLPEKIQDLLELNRINKKLIDSFKKFNLSGEFEFVGVDQGSTWEVIRITSEHLYHYFISCLDVAIYIKETLDIYHKSKESIRHFNLRRGQNKDFTEEDYKNEYKDEVLKDKINEIQSQIKETNGKSTEELHTNLILATKSLIEVLGEGVEFHLSLNPPEYVAEKFGKLEIDYKKLSSSAKIETKKEIKQIESKKE